MRIVRRIFGNIDTHEKKILIEGALAAKKENGYFNHDLFEDSQEYKNIKKLVNYLGLQDDLIGTDFTNEEIEKSDFLVFKGAWANGYPQPETNRRELWGNTFANNCFECGIHVDQIAPWQIKQPKLGSHRLFMLNWVNDVLFADKELYQSFFKSILIEKKEVILYKKNTTIQSVVQLDIPTAMFKLELNNLNFSTCPVCSRIKYTPTVSGFYTSPKENNLTIVRTQEFFGTGHAAFNKIIVSNEIMQQLIKRKLAKIHQFIPFVRASV